MFLWHLRLVEDAATSICRWPANYPFAWPVVPEAPRAPSIITPCPLLFNFNASPALYRHMIQVKEGIP